MIEIEELKDILIFFFNEIKEKGKYDVDIRDNYAYIIPRDEEQYYKPIIRIPDLTRLTELLLEYIEALNEFNERNGIQLKEYCDLSFIFNIMLFNMANSDAEDLNRFIETRINFFKDNHLENYVKPNRVFEYGDVSFYAQRKIDDFRLEAPYIMIFSMNIAGRLYDLPIIRYGINNEGVCFIYAVQKGRERTCETDDPNYKKAVNSVNRGEKEQRDVSPSFVLVLAMFLKVLNDNDISKIVIPDFLFNRYKNYYRASTVKKSDEILSRMFHNITTLIKRMDNQIDGFDIKSYPLDIDSYYHIEISSLNSENNMLKNLLNDNND